MDCAICLLIQMTLNQAGQLTRQNHYLKKINTATKPKDIQRTTSKLISMGYTKINYCGRSFERLSNTMVDSSTELRAHWRRGHWRNQSYGPKLSNRKIIWIMPVIVRKNKAADIQESGHIYLV